MDSESFPSDPDMVDCLTEAISNFFSVACNLGGPSRMSLFGIMTFSSYPEVIIKKKCRYLAMRYKIILICWYLYIIIFFFTKMGDWTAILCIVAPSTYNCSQPGGADLRSIRVILFYECSDYSLYILYLPLLLTNNLPLELRIHMYNYIDDYQIRSKVHHHIFSVDVEVVHDRICKN